MDSTEHNSVTTTPGSTFAPIPLENRSQYPGIDWVRYESLFNYDPILSQRYFNFKMNPITGRTLMFLCLYSPTSIVAFFGNLAVLVIFWKERKELMKVHFNLYILNLTIVDLLIAAVDMPCITINTYHRGFWLKDLVSCGFVLFVDWAFTLMSMITLVGISIDRYWAACFSLSYRRYNSRARTLGCILCMWCAMLVVVLPYFLIDRLSTTNPYYCEVGTSSNILPYLIYLAVCGQHIPSCVMVICSLLIYRAVLKSYRATAAAHGATSAQCTAHGATTAQCTAHGATAAHCTAFGAPTAHCTAHGATTAQCTAHGATSAHCTAHGATAAHCTAFGATTAHCTTHGAIAALCTAPVAPLSRKEQKSETIEQPKEELDRGWSTVQPGVIPKELIDDKSGDKTEKKSELGSEAESEFESQFHTEIRTESKPEIRTESKPEIRSEFKPDVRGEFKQEINSEFKQEIRSELKPDIKSDVTSEITEKLECTTHKGKATIDSKLQKAKKIKTPGVSKEAKIFNSLRYVVGAYLLFWTPYHIWLDLALLSYNGIISPIPSWSYYLTSWLFYVNSAVNPFMYALGNASIKKALLNLLLGRTR